MVATDLMPLAALKPKDYGINASVARGCNRPHAACGIETPATIFHISNYYKVATDLMPLAALKLLF